jgi:hypothetical protein
MSVIMTLRLDGDPAKMEEWAAANPEKMAGIIELAKGHGLIAHRFVGALEGNRMMVADEWPDVESFQAFFAEAEPEIGPMMGAVGVTNEPQPEFWRTLETHDKYGWQA